MSTWAWTISPCQTMPWRWPSGKERLHRNFQGYSTQPDCDLIALGVSAIGRVANHLQPKCENLDEYYDCINQGLCCPLCVGWR